MLITRKSDYALRIIRVLQDGGIHSVPRICREEDVPKAFAYKILREMEAAGFVRSSRGNRGGYSLRVSLDTLTLYDVISLMDEDMAVLHCIREECDRSKSMGGCGTHCEIVRIQNIIEKELKRNSIKSVLAGESGC